MKVLKNFPNIIQTLYYDCGATALMSVLMHYNIYPRLKTLKKETETKKSGTSPEKLVEVSKRYGVKAKLLENMSIRDLEKKVDMGCPVLISIQIKRSSDIPLSKVWGNGHFVVVIGYNRENIYFADPMFSFTTFLKKTELEERWHDSDNYNNRKRIRREKYGIEFDPPNNWKEDNKPKHLIKTLSKLVEEYEVNNLKK